jgi:hypothetical protein
MKQEVVLLQLSGVLLLESSGQTNRLVGQTNRLVGQTNRLVGNLLVHSSRPDEKMVIFSLKMELI